MQEKEWICAAVKGGLQSLRRGGGGVLGARGPHGPPPAQKKKKGGGEIPGPGDEGA